MVVVLRVLLLFGVCWLCSQRALAQSVPRLSDRGRVLLAGSIGGAWSNNARSPGTTRYPEWAAWVEPSVLYFLRDRFALGGYAGYSYRREPYPNFSLSQHLLDVGVESAYELVLAERLGVLLMPQLGYQHIFRKVGEEHGFFSMGAQGRTQQQRSPLRNTQISGPYDLIRAGVFAPLVFHLSASIGVGVGPYFYWDFYLRPRDPYDQSRLQHLQAGVSSWIGGSF